MSYKSYLSYLGVLLQWKEKCLSTVNLFYIPWSMCLNWKWHSKQKKIHFNECKFIFIWMKSLWTLRWTTGFFLLTKNYVLQVSISLPYSYFSVSLLWAVVLFYTAWAFMILILWKHFLIQESTLKALKTQ